ncbi:ATP-grasp domain-containing protein [Streptomyces sp. NPDC050548]|uniref:ATP-grasp domain-containing protein n=1 Tax=Streptomyces sp. NPDC050548 TaxID=3365629 RepID=UPI0037AC7B5A
MAIDPADREAAAAAVDQVAAHTPLAEVRTRMEDRVELTTRPVTQLRLPGSCPLPSAVCRHKDHGRFGDHGVFHVRSVPACDEDTAVEQARRLGYPVVVKPGGRAGSAATLRADNDAEVRQAYRQAGWETLFGLEDPGVVGVLIEECLAGSAIGAEIVVLDGGFHIVAVTRAQLGPEPHHLKTGYTVDARDPLLDAPEVTEAVDHAVRTLGIERGVLHVELRLTAPGPALTEADASPDGDLVPLLVELATGIDLRAATAALAVGTRPDLAPTRRRAAAVQFLYPAAAGRLGPVPPLTALRARPWLERLVWTRRTGEQVTAPPHTSIADRLAHWVVTGDTTTECRRHLADVLSQVADPVGRTTPH